MVTKEVHKNSWRRHNILDLNPISSVVGQICPDPAQTRIPVKNKLVEILKSGSQSDNFCENLILCPFLSNSLHPGVQEKMKMLWGFPYPGVIRSKKCRVIYRVKCLLSCWLMLFARPPLSKDDLLWICC